MKVKCTYMRIEIINNSLNKIISEDVNFKARKSYLCLSGEDGGELAPAEKS